LGKTAEQKNDEGWEAVSLYTSMLAQCLLALLPPAVSALLCLGFWLLLHLQQPELPAAIFDLVSQHPVGLAVWLALGAAGVDYSIIWVANSIGYRSVGAKSSAQYYISRR
jgi:hypothetical protein